MLCLFVEALVEIPKHDVNLLFIRNLISVISPRTKSRRHAVITALESLFAG